MNYPIQLYALKLADDYCYIGQTANTLTRFQAHQLGSGALFTKLHRPFGIIHQETIMVSGVREAMCYENKLTLEYMERYGWQNVRGGDFATPDENQLCVQLQFIYDTSANQVRRYADSLCLYGPSDHYIIYVLQKPNELYYVGSTKRLGRSLAQRQPCKVLDIKVVKPTDGHYLIIKNKMQTQYKH